MSGLTKEFSANSPMTGYSLRQPHIAAVPI